MSFLRKHQICEFVFAKIAVHYFWPCLNQFQCTLYKKLIGSLHLNKSHNQTITRFCYQVTEDTFSCSLAVMSTWHCFFYNVYWLIYKLNGRMPILGLKLLTQEGIHCSHDSTEGIFYGPVTRTVGHLPLHENLMPDALPVPMGGLGINRTIISLWVLWKYNALQLANQRVRCKYLPLSNTKP